MELVYLWVEEYKNIYKQGFNFSPRFECSFDGTNLTIKPKEHIENFFGDNINVTAIIGKNGSGKSSVLNAIINISEGYFSNETDYILVFSDGSDEYYISNFIPKTEIQEAKDDTYKQSFISYLERGNNDNLPIDMGATPLSNSTKYPWVSYREIDISKKTIVNLLAFKIGIIDTSFELSTFMYLPHKIAIKIKTPKELIGENISFIDSKYRIKIEEYFIDLIDIEHQLLIIEYLRKNRSSINGFLRTLQWSINPIHSMLLDYQYTKFFKQFNIIEILKDKQKLPSLKYDILSLTSEKEFLINKLSNEDKNIYLRESGYSHLLNFDLIDEREIRYNDLSHGEQQIFGQLLNLYFYSQNKDKLIFLFDEPETALHPQWQKAYLNEVITLFQNMRKSAHFIFTSHSPFLISDLPKENVIFLDTFNDGTDKNKKLTKIEYTELDIKGLKHKNCINVTKEITIKSFGANIHTLLSDGFFMDGGLMGEFAKTKIQEIMDFLNNEKTIEEISIKENQVKKVIESIGEPFLKQKLLEMYYKKFKDEASKKARKDELLAEQKRIENELKKL